MNEEYFDRKSLKQTMQAHLGYAYRISLVFMSERDCMSDLMANRTVEAGRSGIIVLAVGLFFSSQAESDGITC